MRRFSFIATGKAHATASSPAPLYPDIQTQDPPHQPEKNFRKENKLLQLLQVLQVQLLVLLLLLR